MGGERLNKDAEIDAMFADVIEKAQACQNRMAEKQSQVKWNYITAVERLKEEIEADSERVSEMATLGYMLKQVYPKENQRITTDDFQNYRKASRAPLGFRAAMERIAETNAFDATEMKELKNSMLSGESAWHFSFDKVSAGPSKVPEPILGGKPEEKAPFTFDFGPGTNYVPSQPSVPQQKKQGLRKGALSQLPAFLRDPALQKQEALQKQGTLQKQDHDKVLKDVNDSFRQGETTEQTTHDLLGFGTD